MEFRVGSFIALIIGVILIFIPDFTFFWIGLGMFITALTGLLISWFKSNAKKFDNWVSDR